ncbi:hypothetical protein CVT25_012450 [Psilocybe cyanescens]|uniref:Uncharacterized protein n=1 Tax=Psilocybe cyanescens TaxID=93625 RepID=A0A409XC48_PSICY|nr:hypothetical protein CVT25_012450 [Psilocybe cyanescens]
MNPDWMRQFEDQTKQPVKSFGRGQVDVEIERKFRVIWWEKSNKAPHVFTVLECPHWPKWKITDSEQIALSKSNSVRSSRVYMATNRHLKALKHQKRIGKGRVFSHDESSEGEVEIVGSSDFSELLLYKKESYHPDRTSRGRIHLADSTSLSSRSPSLLPSLAPELCDIISPATGPPPQLVKDKWPNNMYVTDMIVGFRHMKELKREGFGNYEAHFRKAFGQPPPSSPSTYHDQVCRWALAPELLCEASLAAGRTSAGHWALLSKKVPLRNNRGSLGVEYLSS